MSNFKKIFNESFGINENWVPMSSPKGEDDPRQWKMSEVPLYVAKDATGAVEYRVFHFQSSELPPNPSNIEGYQSGRAANEGWFILSYFDGTPHNPIYPGIAPSPQFFATPKEAIQRAKRLASTDHDEEGNMVDMA